MPTSTKTKTTQETPISAKPKEQEITIKKVSGTNIAKIYGLDLTKLEKALKMANKESIALVQGCPCSDDEFVIKFTRNNSSLSNSGLLINKEKSENNVITVTYEPNDIAILVRAQSALQHLIDSGIYEDADEYDRAIAKIETI